MKVNFSIIRGFPSSSFNNLNNFNHKISLHQRGQLLVSVTISAISPTQMPTANLLQRASMRGEKKRKISANQVGVCFVQGGGDL